ncbi:hypothetical protein BsIDN1_51920 [Bacillus safensis]|uniref:Uncharacterized protein n=1 Tax=Bacillus safensis TaxID=561879 RepID=A0A5S9MHF0_BACIA|nr:hypothetical protein BsIDN1_51920 [Bacillus safensis]
MAHTIQAFSLSRIAVRSLRRRPLKTKPKLEKVERYESFADFEPMLDEAVEQIETIIVTNEKKAADEFADLF